MKWLLAAVLATVAVPAALAGARPAPPVLRGFTAWTTVGSQVAFVATRAGSRRGYLWVQRFDAARPTLLRSLPPVGQEEIDELAPGPRGSLGSLERTVGNDGSAYSVDVISSRGGGAVVTRSGVIPHLVGDGAFLGYLAVAPEGTVALYRIGPGARTTRVAVLAGVAKPQQVAVAGGNLAVSSLNGDVAVFTTAGRPLATIAARAASIALAGDRVVVRTRDRHLAVYGLGGGLVHDWRLAAKSWTAGLATDGRYAVYLGANKAVRAVRLANGRDRVVARAGAGFFFDGVALGPAGAVAPLTVQHGSAFTVTLRFVPAATLRAALG